MTLSIWDYLRRRACEAVLAGFHDAFEYLERQDQPQPIHAAAKAFRRRFQEQPDAIGSSKSDSAANPHAPSSTTSTPNSGQPGGAQPSPHGKPPHADSAGNAQAQRRGPGRPRKEVHG